jgi:hypothetical protein
MVKVPMPSVEDYREGQLSLLLGQTGTKRQQEAAILGGSVLGGSGRFIYGQPPEKAPKGSLVLRGPDIQMQSSNKWSGSTTSSIPTYQIVSTIPQQPEVRKPIGTSAGKNAEYFGAADFKAAQQEGYSNKQIRNYLSENPNVVRPISTGAGKSEQFFGKADYERARATGSTNRQILNYLNENQTVLRGRNAAGGGGVYDQLKAKVEDKMKENKNKKNK